MLLTTNARYKEFPKSSWAPMQSSPRSFRRRPGSKCNTSPRGRGHTQTVRVRQEESAGTLPSTRIDRPAGRYKGCVHISHCSRKKHSLDCSVSQQSPSQTATSALRARPSVSTPCAPATIRQWPRKHSWQGVGTIRVVCCLSRQSKCLRMPNVGRHPRARPVAEYCCHQTSTNLG